MESNSMKKVQATAAEILWLCHNRNFSIYETELLIICLREQFQKSEEKRKKEEEFQNYLSCKYEFVGAGTEEDPARCCIKCKNPAGESVAEYDHVDSFFAYR